MKKSIILSYLLLTVSILKIQAADSMPVVRVESSRAIKLEIVNADRANPVNGQLDAAFSESLGYEISQQCKMPVPVKAANKSADEVASHLLNGTCDFAVFIGATVPSSLTNSDFVRIRAVPASGDTRYVIVLVAPSCDRSFVQTLRQSFPGALKGVFFQKALARHSNQLREDEKSEWQVAMASAD